MEPSRDIVLACGHRRTDCEEPEPVHVGDSRPLCAVLHQSVLHKWKMADESGSLDAVIDFFRDAPVHENPAGREVSYIP